MKKKVSNVLAKIEKSVKKSKNTERTFYDVYSKQRGYLCSCPTEEDAHKALHDLFKENERFWRRARSEGKKSRNFDCYAVARTGTHSRLIELMFDDNTEDDEDYEDVVAKENA